MPSKNPRINVVLDDNLYKNIQLLAESDGVSLSAKVKDLIKQKSLERFEEAAAAADPPSANSIGTLLFVGVLVVFSLLAG